MNVIISALLLSTSATAWCQNHWKHLETISNHFSSGCARSFIQPCQKQNLQLPNRWSQGQNLFAESKLRRLRFGSIFIPEDQCCHGTSLLDSTVEGIAVHILHVSSCHMAIFHVSSCIFMLIPQRDYCADCHIHTHELDAMGNGYVQSLVLIIADACWYTNCIIIEQLGCSTQHVKLERTSDWHLHHCCVGEWISRLRFIDCLPPQALNQGVISTIYQAKENWRVPLKNYF